MQIGTIEKMKIKSELHIIWITTDGAKFINKEDAILWQESINEEDQQE
tara:strand:+ start:6843 stop:6986 length:144 start_codon:yes stop_codon:yes gene_type:complete